MRFTPALRFSVFSLSLTAALSAHALVFTNLNRNIVVQRPLSGSIEAFITGTLSTSVAGEALGGATIPMAVYSFGGANLPYPGNIDLLEQITAEIDAHNTYTGRLFSYVVSSTSPFGTYQYQIGSDHALSVYTFTSTKGRANDVSTNFSITVSAVPEPASMGALALGALAFIRRQKRR